MKIHKGVVAVTENGKPFVVIGICKSHTPEIRFGWYGVGFDGKEESSDMPEVVAADINEFISNIAATVNIKGSVLVDEEFYQ
jgi:hypothetical protein